MPPDDILLNKAAIIERCCRRVQEELRANPDLDNYTHVDALTLNVERACQAAIDMAMHVVAIRHLGMPQSSADAFRLLGSAGVLGKTTVLRLQAMTGFRNIAVHQYQVMDPAILRRVAEHGWQDLQQFCVELGLRVHLG